MKRYGRLYDDICSFENLWLAARKAQRGKRLKPNVARFNCELEHELPRLREELQSQTYRPAAYREFYILEPKRRLISAAPYRDRVVHHALCNVIEPIFERAFHFDSYACRRGKGTHAAVDRLQGFMQSNRYALKCDVREYFPSVDHELLLAAVARKIKCRRTLWLAGAIIAHSNEQGGAAAYFPDDDLFTPHLRRRGLPIGNQTSQFFANVYLNGFDHWMTETHPHLRYVRYVDDFIVLGNDKRELRELREEARARLAAIRLRLHPTKCQVAPASDGVEFLGYRVFPSYRRLRAENPRRYGRRLRALRHRFRTGEVTLDEVGRSVHAWIGHAKHAETKGLREQVLGAAVFCRGTTGHNGWCVGARGTTTKRTTSARPIATTTIPPIGTTTTGSVAPKASHEIGEHGL